MSLVGTVKPNSHMGRDFLRCPSRIALTGEHSPHTVFTPVEILTYSFGVGFFSGLTIFSVEPLSWKNSSTQAGYNNDEE